ncbi:DUF1501 domain-containing protein [Thalassomonas actiniarum]|nr:DUF1501 domain-containing protein [Thalassomonas actiniarum]
MKMNRRQFLKNSTALATATGLGSLTAVSSALSSFSALAATGDDYKALVCVFLHGGMDNHDTVLPYDQPSYNRYAQIRRSLVSQYQGQRDRNNLLPLNPDNAAGFGGRAFALPPQMPGISNLFAQGNAAIIGNVGPLITPATQTEFEQESVALPSRLFSHNDQQATWLSSSPEGAVYGWGGAFADATISAGQNSNREFSVITSGGNDLFLTGEHAIPYQINAGEAQEIKALGDVDDNEALAQLLASHFSATDFSSSNLAQQDIAAALAKSSATNNSYNRALAGIAPLTTSFPQSHLARQLQGVARTIGAKETLGVKRQVFIVGMGGFDTHSEQAKSLPELHAALDGAITAFYTGMLELGLGDKVTLFTASDFGRTLAVNDDGTDHGWGGHHFVIGDAVNGRNIYGNMPPMSFGHAQDAGSGRLIPTTSVEQMAEPLGRWFGLTEQQLAQALPNLNNFSSRLNFI